MRIKYWIVIAALLVVCSCVTCTRHEINSEVSTQKQDNEVSTQKQDNEVSTMNSLSICIGPLSEVHFDSSRHSWVFDIPVILVNNGNKILYIPNPEFRYSSWGDLRFFLVNRDGISIEERPIEAVLIFGEDSWKKLAAGESMGFSKHVIVNQIEGMNAQIETSDLQNIIFFSESWMGDKYKIRNGEYKLFVRFAYDNQRPEDRQWWLERANLPLNDVELSRFWYGQIESNHLTLNLGKQKESEQ